jgi:hypothetical protein
MADIKAADLTRLLMERLGLTGTGYLTVRWKNGKPGSYAVRWEATYEVRPWQSEGTVASATRPERRALPTGTSTVKIMGQCGDKADNLTITNDSIKAELIDSIVDKLGEPRGSYVIETRDARCRLQTELKIEEGWIYKPRRTSPPETQEEQEDQEGRDEKRGEPTEKRKTEYEQRRERDQTIVRRVEEEERQKEEARKRRGNRARPLLNRSSLRALG